MVSYSDSFHLRWVNALLGSSILTLQGLTSGVEHCKIMAIGYPGSIDLSKFNLNPKSYEERLKNWELLRDAFTKENLNGNRLIQPSFLAGGCSQHFLSEYCYDFYLRLNGRIYLHYARNGRPSEQVRPASVSRGAEVPPLEPCVPVQVQPPPPVQVQPRGQVQVLQSAPPVQPAPTVQPAPQPPAWPWVTIKLER